MSRSFLVMKSSCLVFFLSLSLSAAAPTKTVVDLAVATPNLSTLVRVLTRPDYAPVLTALSGTGPFTVFAPTNEAFTAAGIDVKDVSAVTAVLQYHVISGSVPSSALQASQSVATLQGGKLTVKKNKNGVTVNDANVVTADILVLMLQSTANSITIAILPFSPCHTPLLYSANRPAMGLFTSSTKSYCPRQANQLLPSLLQPQFCRL